MPELVGQTGRYRTRTSDLFLVREEKGEHKPAAKQEVAEGGDEACTSACTREAENRPNRTDRLRLLADLLADVPAAERADVIRELTPAERVAVAKLLVRRGNE